MASQGRLLSAWNASTASRVLEPNWPSIAPAGYGPKLKAENEEIADLLVGLTDARKTWGFGLCFLHLRNVKGHPWNHKRVYRIYCELELNLRIKPRKRLKRDKTTPLPDFIEDLQNWHVNPAVRRFVAHRQAFHRTFCALRFSLETQ